MNNCTFNYNGECSVLCRENCIGCSFAKTNEELKNGREKALRRIAHLPNEKRTHILRKYYRNKQRGVLAEW